MPLLNGTTDEERPLLGNGNTEPSAESIGTRLQKHMTTNVTKSWGDLILLSCYIITGLLDSSAVFIWQAFVSMQTGNTVYFGLGIVAPSSSDRWIKSGLSIGSFCFGSFLFSLGHRTFSPRQRWVLVISFSLQTLIIVIAALIVTLGDKNEEGLNWQVLLPIAIVAFQAAGQAVTSRVLQYGQLTTVVLTSNYIDLFGDPNAGAAPTKNVARNHRIAAPLLLLTGAAMGGAFAHSEVGLAGALWTAAGLKLGIVVAWCLWSEEEEEEDE